MEILNYQGNKTKLLDFIDRAISPLMKKDMALLDIFSGGASVSAYFANKYPVISNDYEPYAYHIANSIICSNKYVIFDDSFNKLFKATYESNLLSLINEETELVKKEKEVLDHKLDIEGLYNIVPTIWNGKYSNVLKSEITFDSVSKRENRYCLFTLLYSSNYFGLKQAMEIDSLICAIESTPEKYNKSFLYAALFYSMNKCVFSKDGHMAQPLNIAKNPTRCFKCRSKSIVDYFYDYFSSIKPSDSFSKLNRSYNSEFEDLLKKIDAKNISCIYADPPYTDMQYSRYYHLLNVACEYSFSLPTMKGDKYSSGLYLSNRRQSGISVRKTFLVKMRNLCLFAKRNCINLVISFGYPNKDSEEKKDRYLCSISELNEMAASVFGEENVKLLGQNYEHSNQRNSKHKKVIEYLIVCRGDKND